jgi:NTE family protein
VSELPTSTEHGFRAALGLPREQRRGVALCFSGGGYRASLFHLGAMTRLDELGILSKVDTFSSVSGGSIALAQLVTHRRSLGDGWPAPGGRVASFGAGVVEPLRAFVQRDIRTRTLLDSFRPTRWLDQNAGVEGLARHYETGPAPGRADDLPKRPRFVFCATDLSFRTQWTVDTAERLAGSDQAGYGPHGDFWTLARAVAASSCFPPAFRAMLVRGEPRDLSGGGYDADDRDELVRRIELSDGGVHDNLGLEPVWRDHSDVLVSDAAPSLTVAPRIHPAVWRQLRMIVTLVEQATDVRKRWLIANYAAGELGGAYWGIGSLPSHYPPPPPGRPTAPTFADDLVRRYLAPVRIDLDPFSAGEIAALENHGYAMADLAVATHAPHLVEAGAPAPELPHGEEPLAREFVERELGESDRTKLFRRRLDRLLRR